MGMRHCLAVGLISDTVICDIGLTGAYALSRSTAAMTGVNVYLIVFTR